MLDQILCDDTDLKLAISKAKQSDNKKKNFKSTASHIILKCPVAQKQTMKTIDTKQAETSATESDQPSKKHAIGKTGVESRYHASQECTNLLNPQQAELCE